MRNNAFAVFFVFGARSFAQECPPLSIDPSYFIQSDEYWLEARGADGAIGDVIPVTISLHSQLPNPGWIALDVALCHDPQALEIVGEPIYSEELLSLIGVFGIYFYPVDEAQGASGNPQGHGIIVPFDFNPEAYNARFPSELPLPLMTAYYRIKGEAAGTTELSFCDGALAVQNVRCSYNHIHAYGSDHTQGNDYLSHMHIGTTLHVLDGPATHPDRPPEPPTARVYAERPTADQVDFQVRIGGAFAAPGAKGIPVEVEVSAGVEYSGIQVPIDFDERYLRLTRVEQNFLSGAVVINNRDETLGADATEGYAVIFSGLGPSSRRLALEGEVVKAATLYFDVLEAAAEIESTTLSVATVGTVQSSYPPWVGVHHHDGVGVQSPVVRSEIEPIITRSGIFGLRGPLKVLLGDANFDSRLDISDPILVLNYLFRTEDVPACANAADFNQDTRLDISDPISMLGTLFLGAPVPGDSDQPLEVDCE